MHMADPTGTHDDPFDFGAVLVIDTAPPTRRAGATPATGARPPAPRPARALRSALP